MEVAILTVGDEILAGDIENTNATWLARRLTEGGATVARILAIPDDRETIASTIHEWSEAFDAVVVTGGLGGTHDDVTVDAIADVFDRDLAVSESVREDVVRTVAQYRDRNPETIEAYELDLDVDAWAALPEGSRPIENPEGLCPGCALGNVYAFPGIPDEMEAMFELVAPEFRGDVVSRSLYTPQPEGSMVDALDAVRDRFDVTVGSYPSTDGHNRVKVLGTDAGTVGAATEWLSGRIDVIEDE